MVNSKQDLNKTTYESLASVDTFDAADLKQTEKYIFDKYFKPPGIILDGKINDRQNFLAALKAVHLQLIKSKTNSS